MFLITRKIHIAHCNMELEIIFQYISMIREGNSIDEKVKLLEELNRLLPDGSRLSIPSLITNDYVSKAVNTVEESWLQSRWRTSKPICTRRIPDLQYWQSVGAHFVDSSSGSAHCLLIRTRYTKPNGKCGMLGMKNNPICTSKSPVGSKNKLRMILTVSSWVCKLCNCLLQPSTSVSYPGSYNMQILY